MEDTHTVLNGKSDTEVKVLFENVDYTFKFLCDLIEKLPTKLVRKS